MKHLSHCILALLSSALLIGAVPQNSTYDNFVIRNVRIFDGERVLEEQDVAVENGIIVRLGIDVEAPDVARVIDGKGLTLLPGLIDAHTHTISPEIQETSLAVGVTTELDMFASWQMVKGIRARQESGLNANRSDVFSAGTLVTSPNGHGTEYGFSIPTIETPDEAVAFVDARLEEGSDFIKVVYDDGAAFGISMPTIDKATLSAVITAAHDRGKLAIIHIGSYQGAFDALELGADGIVHMFYEAVDDAAIAKFVALAVKNGAFVTPTMTVLESASGIPSGASLVEDERLARYVTAEWLSNLQLAFPGEARGKAAVACAMKTIRELGAAGVSILAGSDAPNPGTAHGVSLHRELELLVQAGLKPVAALRAATSAAARRFGLSDRGVIRTGLRADLVLVHGDPTVDILATRDIVAIWKRGIAVDREAVSKRIAEASAMAASAKASEHAGGVGNGRVSDFESDGLATLFGAGWSVSTDAFMGGSSEANLAVAEVGANGTERSMHITGAVAAGDQPWAGAIFAPGPWPMSPVDLSSMKSVSFWVKGKPGTYFAMCFLQSKGYTPAVQTIEVTEEWTAITLPFASFDGTDGSDLMGFYVGAGDIGPMEFWLDEVRFDRQ